MIRKILILIIYITCAFSTNQPFKIKVNTEKLQISDPNAEEFFLRSIESVVQFVSELIEIEHEDITLPSSFTCADGIDSSDLGIISMTGYDFLLILSDKFQDDGRYNIGSSKCQYDGGYELPSKRQFIHHFVVSDLYLQKNYMDQEKDSWFQEILVPFFKHEAIHFLGFTIPDIKNYDSDVYTQPSESNVFRGLQTGEIVSNIVKQKVGEHFGCQDVSKQGAQLENANFNLDDSIQGHWESTVFAQETMAITSDIGSKSLSEISLALLESSGWYTAINYQLAEKMYWGKDQGCDFIQNACKDRFQKFSEFPEIDLTDQYTNSCTFDYNYIGNKYQTGALDFYEGCPIVSIRTVGTRQCATNKIESNAITFEKESRQSKCFLSSVIETGYPQQTNHKCYEAKCEGNLVYLILDGVQQNPCIRNNQLIEVNQVNVAGNKQKGQIQCPDNLERFCFSQKYQSPCRDGCSSKGYCVQGKCRCLLGFGGENCDISLSADIYIYTDSDGSNQQNSSDCPDNYYIDTDQYPNNLFTCLKCFEGCRTCSGPEYYQCLSCEGGYSLSDFKCLKTCEYNPFCNEQCYAGDKCDKCQIQQNNQLGICQTSCEDGFYSTGNPDYICNQCPLKQNCLTCEPANGTISGLDVKCTSCDSYSFKNKEVQMVLFQGQCYENCPTGYFEQNRVCIQCNINCAKCSGDRNDQCTACYLDKVLYENTCVESCPEDYRDIQNLGICEEDLCDIAKKDGVCVFSCAEDEYILNLNRSCQKCSSKCKKCIDYQDKCIECNKADDYIVNYQCQSSLPSSSVTLKEISQSQLQFSIYYLIFFIILVFQFNA